MEKDWVVDEVRGSSVKNYYYGSYQEVHNGNIFLLNLPFNLSLPWNKIQLFEGAYNELYEDSREA